MWSPHSQDSKLRSSSSLSIQPWFPKRLQVLLRAAVRKAQTTMSAYFQLRHQLKMKSILSVFFLCFAVSRAQDSRISREAKYPRFERSCFRNMPASELNECLKYNFQQNIPKYRSAGIPGMINGSIDPHDWPKFTQYFGSNFLSGGLTVMDLKLWGWSNLKVSNIRANVKNPDQMLVDMDWKVPTLDIAGRFDLAGNLGRAKFHGGGPFTLNLTGLSGTWKVVGSRAKGAKLMEIKSFKGRPKVQTFKVYAPGTVFGNERLGNAIVAAINAGWKLFHQIADPAIEREWGNYCKDRLNQVFLSVSYDELFPLKPESA